LKKPPPPVGGKRRAAICCNQDHQELEGKPRMMDVKAVAYNVTMKIYSFPHFIS